MAKFKKDGGRATPAINTSALPDIVFMLLFTPRVQLNDAFASIDDIQEYITVENSKKDEKEVPYMTTSLKADVTVKMGVITDIKQELRKVNALKLSYTAAKVARKE